jgi:hypothetical protein
MSSSVKMEEDLLPHTTVDMVALAHASASPRRRSVRRSPPRYSPPPALDTIGSVGVRPVTLSSRGDPRRDGARARARVRGSGASRSRLAGRRRRGFSDGEWVGQFGLVLMVQSYTSYFLRPSRVVSGEATVYIYSGFSLLLCRFLSF